MKRFVLVLTTTLLVTVNLAGCGGAQMEALSENVGNPWVDIQSEGHDVNDSEFVPAFVKANKASFNKLAKMLLSYDFSFQIGYYNNQMYVSIQNKVTSSEESRLKNEVLQNKELMQYISALLEIKYIVSVGRQSESINRVAISFEGRSTSNGSLSRGVAYIPIKDWISSLFKGDIQPGHITGNWYYRSSPRI